MELSQLRCLMFQGSLDTHENTAYGDLRLGGMYLIRNVLEQHKIQTETIDFIHKATPDDLHRINEIIKKFNPHFITISDTFIDKSLVYKFLYDVKMYHPHLVIIAGSSNPQPAPNRLLDYRIYSYGENAIIPVLEHHYQRKPLKYKMIGKTKWINALHDYIAWPKEDYALKYKPDDFMTRYEAGCLELSRGCRFKCKFCNWPILGIKEDTSQKNLDSIVEALNHNYHTQGVYSYLIADDTFNDRDEKIIKLANIVKQLDFVPEFAAFIRLDLLWSRPHQLELLADARVTGQHYGIETFNVESAKIIGKGKIAEIAKETLNNVRKVFKKRKMVYFPTISMIAGLPFDTVEDCEAADKWLREEFNNYVVWYALDIPIKGMSLSAFGEDFTKFGYEIVNDTSVVVPTKNTEGAYWKNKHWDTITAAAWVKEKNDYYNTHFLSGWFQVWKEVPKEKRNQNGKKYLAKKLDYLEKKYYNK